MNNPNTAASPLRPKVTIAIPTYNRKQYVGETIASALAQTYANVEIVISDNASDDGTGALLDEFRSGSVLILSQPYNLGMARNWDACLQASRGEFFLLLSDDDLLLPTAIESLLQAYFVDGIECAEVAFAYGRAVIIDGQGNVVREGINAPARERSQDALIGFFSSKRPTFPCSILMRTADVRRCGGYAADGIALSADARVWMSVALQRPEVRFVDEVVCQYREHASNLTVTSEIEQWLANNDALLKHCDIQLRQRGESSLGHHLAQLCARLNLRTAYWLLRRHPRYRHRSVASVKKLLQMRSRYPMPLLSARLHRYTLLTLLSDAWILRLKAIHRAFVTRPR